MQRLTIDYISYNEFIINDRYWIYFDGYLYIYDHQREISQDVKSWKTYDKTHNIKSICKRKFETFKNYILLVSKKHPLSVTDQYNYHQFSKNREYSFLRSILGAHLYRTSYILLVDGYYDFSLVQKAEEEKCFVLTHNATFDKIEFATDEKCRELKKYIDDNQIETINDKLKFLGIHMFDLVNYGFSTYEYR